MADGEQVYFLPNDRNARVKNGSLGTIEQLRDGKMAVTLQAEGLGEGLQEGTRCAQQRLRP